MKSEQQIIKQLTILYADDRCFDKDGTRKPAASIFENAPLAITQIESEATVISLKWVLED